MSVWFITWRPGGQCCLLSCRHVLIVLLHCVDCCDAAPVLQSVTQLSLLSGGVLTQGPAQYSYPSAQRGFPQQLRVGSCPCVYLCCRGVTQLSLLGGGVLIQGPSKDSSTNPSAQHGFLQPEGWCLRLLAPLLQGIPQLSLLGGGVLIQGPAKGSSLDPYAQHDFLIS
jgi:hypothetical protein